jgi:RNA-directed DNA polymerase
MSVISKLANELDQSEVEVTATLVNAPMKYKVYSIPKRTSGHRVIAHPSKELKKLQRAFITLCEFPVHVNAMAYKKGISIKDNAQFHSKQCYLLKMDLSNFFNSITPKLFWSQWEKKWPLPKPLEVKWIENLLFWKPKKGVDGELFLSVGAPSSPLISNFCMYYFDELLTTICVEKGVHYTRYADDMTFSTNQENILCLIPDIVKNNLKKCFGSCLSINHRKTVFSSKAHNRHVTGITITNDGKLSLGRERKRYIKHLVHQYKLGRLSSEDISHLKGLLAFANHIEPNFIISLNIKYSVLLIKQILEN